MRPHVEHLYRLAYRFTGSRHGAEDLVQDLLLKLFPRYEDMVRVEKLRPWLVRVMHRLYIDQLRSAGRSPLSAVEESGTEPDDQPDDARAVEDLVAGQFTREALQQAFAALNEDQRALLALHDIEGYTLVELEQMLETPIGTLKSRLNRGRRRMRELLKEPFDESGRV